MIALPPPDRLWLASFWVAFSLVAAVVTSGVAWVAGLEHWIGVGALVLLGLGLAAIARPRILPLPYRVWNRAAHEYSRVARHLLMGLAFYTLVTATARAGSTVRLRSGPAAASGWVPRRTLSPDAYSRQHDSSGDPNSSHWLRAFLGWARRPGRLWTVPLALFAVLIRMVDSGNGDDVPEDIYTLY